MIEVGRGWRRTMGGATVVLGGATTAALLVDARAAFSTAELVVLPPAGWFFIGSGLGVWARRPGNRTGPLLVLVGLSFLLGLLRVADEPVLQVVGEWIDPIFLALLTYVLLAFPTGRLASTFDRVIVGVAFVDLIVVFHAPLIVGGSAAATGLAKASFAVGAAAFFSAAAVLLWRWIGASSAWRKAVAPVLWPATVALAALGYYDLTGFVTRPGPVSIWVFRIAFVVIPFAFLAVLLRVRLARAAVAELVVELDRAHALGTLRGALARALGDPGLAVAYWLPNESRYVDLSGRPFEPPGGAGGQVTTVVEREGRRVAAIVHDQALTEEPELLRAVSAAAALALDNERLQAELRARLDELDASRMRIVEATDVERRRIERQLHDGTQQRLTAVTLSLGLAAAKLTSDPDTARASLGQARQVLAAALSELRDLSQGIHHSGLAGGGLGPALEDLAYTIPLPVRIVATVDGRLPDPVEEAAYYVVAESLTNVVKHAQASAVTVDVSHLDGRLVVSVRDDGVGGADPSGGSGLRGLADRMHAVGGTFTVTSRVGRGTEVRAELPCEAPCG